MIIQFIMNFDKREKLRRIEDIEFTFNNTPVYKFNILYKGKEMTIYGKSEMTSFTSSVKDRVMRYIVRDALQNHSINNETTFIDATSGNSGIALSHLCAYIGQPCEVATPTWTTDARVNLIAQTGAKVTKLSEEDRGYQGAIDYSLRQQKEGNFFCTNQFGNKLNIEAHKFGEMKEFFQLFKDKNIEIDVFAGGYGTGGMIMSFAEMSKMHGFNAKVYPLEPKTANLMEQGHKPGYSSLSHLVHRVEGISDDLIPLLIDEDKLSKVIVLDDSEAILMAQKINKMGLPIGISAAFNIIGCLEGLYLNNKNTGAVILCDNNSKYMSTDLFKTEKDKDGSFFNSVKDVSLSIIK